MGVTLYITLERAVAGLDPNAQDRVLICRIQDELAEIASELGVPPLTLFYSYGVEEILKFVDDKDERARLRATAEPTPFFAAEDVRRTAEALHRHVVANGPVILKKQDVTSRVLNELQSCIDVASAAGKAGVRCRLHPGE